MQFEFHGLDELVAELEKTGQDVEDAKKQALQKSGEHLQDETIKSAKPRWRTGNLERHIKLSEVEGDEIEVYVDQQGKAYYGYFLEVGTSKMPAYPFMFPAFMNSRNKLEQIMASEIRDKLRAFT